MSQTKPASLIKRNEGAGYLDYVRCLLLIPSGMPKVLFAPASVPFLRRKQMAGIVFFYSMMAAVSLVGFASLIYFGSYWFLIPYVTYMYFDDRFESGGRASQWIKKLSVWRYIGDYFPMKLMKEVDLDPNGKYMFVYHPHGVLANGAVIGFATEALGLSKLMPGIQVHPLTLKINFYIPFYRDIAYAMGFRAVTKRSITSIFKQGQSCLIAVGGAEEFIHAKPHSADLVLKNRMGFVQMAIKAGASLVPVYAFGENECFDVIVPETGSPMEKFQHNLKKLTGFTIPLCAGRSIFTYNYGHLPKRHPVNIIIGPPIPIEMDPNPSREKVVETHRVYLDALRDLYDRNKERYTHGLGFSSGLRKCFRFLLN